MAAYAKKSKGSSRETSGGDSGDNSNNNDKGTDKSSSSDTKGPSDNEQQQGDIGSTIEEGGSNTGTENDLQSATGGGETGPITPPPTTCEQGSAAPECSGSTGPPPPPPPGPVDCSTNPNDPSCKTTSEPVDCNTNPNYPSCGTPPPVDCKANPNDESCTTPPIDCTTTPDDPSCKPDCTKKQDDPSCKQPPCDPNTENCPPIDCTKNPDDPSCKVDCTTNPSDPSCPPTPPCQPAAVIGISCPPPPPPPPSCPPQEHYDPDKKKCVPDIPKCPAVQAVSGGSSNDCPICSQASKGITSQCPVPVCKPGEHFDPNQNKCIPDNCPKDQHFDSKLGKCVPNPQCKKDERYDAIQNKCLPICSDGTELLNGKCHTKTLSLSIAVAKDPIVRGHEQTITVKVSDENSHQRISGANVQGNVLYATGSTDNRGKFSGLTDNNGVVSHTWPISGNAIPGKFTTNVQASKDGYKSATETESFMVKAAESDTGGGEGGDRNQGVRSPAMQQIKYFKEFTDMPANSPLYITTTSMHKDILNDIVITGEIKNRGINTANFVELIATFYNINNQTVGNENTFTKPSTLQPGQAAPFTMYLSPKDMPLSQIKSVKYHLSWKYAVSSTTSSSTSISPSAAGKILLLPNTSS